MLWVTRQLFACVDVFDVLTENKVEFPVFKFTHDAYSARRQKLTLFFPKKEGTLGEGSFALKNLYFSHCLSSHALFKGKTLPFKGILLQGKLPHV